MGAGRPSYKVNDIDRKIIAGLLVGGTTHQRICDVIGFTLKTFYKYYRKEINETIEKANSNVAQSLYNQAISGNVTAQIFWLKTRARWRETDRDDYTRDLLPKIEVKIVDPNPTNHNSKPPPVVD